MDESAYVIAVDGVEYPFSSDGQEWLVSWYPPAKSPPAGTRHGSAGVCVTADHLIVIVSENGESWVLPGGRPEGDEDWRETLDREVWEEACARVQGATLLGYAKGVCIRGPETGRVIVRALWRAEVVLEPWQSRFEIAQRLVVSPTDASERIVQNEVYARLFAEALKIGPAKDW